MIGSMWSMKFVCNHMLLRYYCSPLLFSIPKTVLDIEVQFEVYEGESIALLITLPSNSSITGELVRNAILRPQTSSSDSGTL